MGGLSGVAQPYPYPYHPGPPPTRKPFSTVDLVLTPLLSGLLLLGCVAGFVFSMFAAMATDACGGIPDRCHDGLIGAAYVVAWGGMALAVVLTIAGVAIAAVRRTTMFIWPLVGLVVFVSAMVIGGLVLNAGVGG